MIRYQIHIDENALAALKGIQERTGTPVAWQVREAIDAYLKSKNHYPLPKDPRQLELDLS
jgi:predicted DNA-binding protein